MTRLEALLDDRYYYSDHNVVSVHYDLDSRVVIQLLGLASKSLFDIMDLTVII